MAEKKISPADQKVVDGLMPVVDAAFNLAEELAHQRDHARESLNAALEERERLTGELAHRPTEAQLTEAEERVRTLSAEVADLTSRIDALQHELAERPSNPEQIVDLIREMTEPRIQRLRAMVK